MRPPKCISWKYSYAGVEGGSWASCTEKCCLVKGAGASGEKACSKRSERWKWMQRFKRHTLTCWTIWQICLLYPKKSDKSPHIILTSSSHIFLALGSSMYPSSPPVDASWLTYTTLEWATYFNLLRQQVLRVFKCSMIMNGVAFLLPPKRMHTHWLWRTILITSNKKGLCPSCTIPCDKIGEAGNKCPIWDICVVLKTPSKADVDPLEFKKACEEAEVKPIILEVAPIPVSFVPSLLIFCINYIRVWFITSYLG